MPITVSVLIPVYNVEQYIEKCICSIMNQDYQGAVECIIIDDCCTDNTMLLVQQLLSQYKGNIEFSIIHHDRNRGVSAARNSAVKAAKYEYLFFVDSDDYIYPSALSTLVALANKYRGIDIVRGSYDTNGGCYLSIWRDDVPEYIGDKRLVDKYFFSQIPIMHNRLIRRELIVNNDLYFPEGYIYEDEYWVVVACRYVQSIAFCKEKTYFYNTRAGSIVSSTSIEKKYNILADLLTIMVDEGKVIDNDRVLIRLLDFFRLTDDNLVGLDFVDKEGYRRHRDEAYDKFIRSKKVPLRMRLAMRLLTKKSLLNGTEKPWRVIGLLWPSTIPQIIKRSYSMI